MGIIYGAGNDVDETAKDCAITFANERRADGSPVFTPLVGLLADGVLRAVLPVHEHAGGGPKRETGGFGWPAFLFGYMTVLAWVVSFAVYQGGRLLGYA